MSQELDKNEKRNRAFGYISIFTGLVPILLFLFCYINSKGAKGDEVAIWWLMILYVWSVGIPLFIASLILSIYGLKSSKKIPAILGLISTFSPIIIIFVLIIKLFIFKA